MKLIDEKGNLFGKINIIDFLFIFFIVCLVPLLLFSHKIYKMRTQVVEEEPKEFIELELDCKLIKIKPELIQSIAIGDKETDEKGITTVEVIWLGKPQPYQYSLDIGGGKTVNKEDSLLKEIPTKIKVKAELRGNKLYYKDRQVALNSPIDFKTSKYTVEAVPAKEEEFKSLEDILKEGKLIRIDLAVVFKDLSEDAVKLISIGDKELDETGNIVAEIIELGRVGKNFYEIDLGNGESIAGEDSTRRQIYTKLRLLCEIDNDNQLYYKDSRIESGSKIIFKSDKYFAKGEIAKYFEKAISSLQNKVIRVRVKFSGLLPEIANVVTVGNIEKDPEGNIVGRLQRIAVNRPSDILTFRENKYITVSHPFLKDIEADLEITCVQKDNVLYFKNYPVKMGNAITFTTDLYSISGVIIAVEY